MFDFEHFFAGIDVQIVVEHEVNVVGQQLFARGFFAAGFQRAFIHLQLVWRREESAADRIQPNRIGDRAFFKHQIAQTFPPSCFSGGKARRAGADDQ